MTTHSSVLQFMLAQQYPVGVDLTEFPNDDVSRFLFDVANELGCVQASIDAKMSESNDVRLARMSLLVEEITELADALAERDEVAAADAVADIEFVNVGNSVTFGWPHGTLVKEVCRSNSTKPISGEHKPEKTGDYSPPDIRSIIDESRTTRETPF